MLGFIQGLGYNQRQSVKPPSFKVNSRKPEADFQQILLLASKDPDQHSQLFIRLRTR
jgi:hypothetical protein